MHDRHASADDLGEPVGPEEEQLSGKADGRQPGLRAAAVRRRLHRAAQPRPARAAGPTGRRPAVPPRRGASCGMGIFLLYLSAISLVADIRRVFAVPRRGAQDDRGVGARRAPRASRGAASTRRCTCAAARTSCSWSCCIAIVVYSIAGSLVPAPEGARGTSFARLPRSGCASCCCRSSPASRTRACASARARTTSLVRGLMKPGPVAADDHHEAAGRRPGRGRDPRVRGGRAHGAPGGPHHARCRRPWSGARTRPRRSVGLDRRHRAPCPTSTPTPS